MKVRYGPSGVHLFSRASGQNILIDEAVPPQAMWSEAPRQVSIAITNACDLSCAYCYAPKTTKSLTINEILAWSYELDSAGTFGIGFGGGEPTLHPDFENIIIDVSSKTKLSTSFTTHGHHLNVNLLNKIRKHAHFVRISMDGTHEVYERNRHRSFTSLLSKLSLIAGYFPFGINYVVNEVTLSGISEAASIAEYYGASELLLLPQRETARAYGIEQKTRSAMITWIKSYSGPLQIALPSGETEGLEFNNPTEKESGLMSYCHIDASGILKRTSYSTTGISIGDTGPLAALKKIKNNKGNIS